MAAAVVQGTGFYTVGISASNIVKVFASGVTVGNKIIVFARCASGGLSITGVSDDLGNTYTERLAYTGNRYKMYEAPVTTGGTCTVTVALEAATTSRAMTITEASGLGAYDTGLIDGSNNAGSVAADGDATPAITTAEAGEFIAATIYNTAGAWTSIAPGTGYSEVWKDASAAAIESEYKVAGAAGSYTATWTAGDTDTFAYMVAAFKAALGGSPYPSYIIINKNWALE